MLEPLLKQQNRDGGWPYTAGASWTEPTVYAVIAAWAAGERQAAARGAAWLRSTQRPDGGFSPRHGVEESTWVTSLAALLPAATLDAGARGRAVEWLLRMTGRETTGLYRLRQFLLGNQRPPEQEFDGWPWYPGTAAWVGPTALGILALRKAQSGRASARLAQRIESGRRFLLTRACLEGGWNHGSSRALGFEGRAYPETTGMALLALEGARGPEVERGLDSAARALASCRFADGLNWLRLGLLAHRRLPAGYCPPALSYRTARDRSLALLVDAAAAGRNLFLS